MLIRIDQKAKKFPLFFHRARLWIDFIQKNHPEPLIIAVNRRAYTTACHFFPEIHVHRLPDDSGSQLEKTLHLSKGHDSYCQFSSEPGILQSPGLIQKRIASVYFGPPDDSTIHCNLLVHGGIDAKMKAYACNASSRLLVGPKYAFPMPTPPLWKPVEKREIVEALLFLAEPLDGRIRNLIEGVFRDLQIPLTTLQPGSSMEWPSFKRNQLILSPAGLHFQELSSCIPGVISFAGTTDSIEQCYSLSAARLAHNLGWLPAFGREALTRKVRTILAQPLKKQGNMPAFPPSFFETIHNLMKDVNS